LVECIDESGAGLLAGLHRGLVFVGLGARRCLVCSCVRVADVRWRFKCERVFRCQCALFGGGHLRHLNFGRRGSLIDWRWRFECRSLFCCKRIVFGNARRLSRSFVWIRRRFNCSSFLRLRRVFFAGLSWRHFNVGGRGRVADRLRRLCGLLWLGRGIALRLRRLNGWRWRFNFKRCERQ